MCCKIHTRRNQPQETASGLVKYLHTEKTSGLWRCEGLQRPFLGARRLGRHRSHTEPDISFTCCQRVAPLLNAFPPASFTSNTKRFKDEHASCSSTSHNSFSALWSIRPYGIGLIWPWKVSPFKGHVTQRVHTWAAGYTDTPTTALVDGEERDQIIFRLNEEISLWTDMALWFKVIILQVTTLWK